MRRATKTPRLGTIVDEVAAAEIGHALAQHSTVAETTPKRLLDLVRWAKCGTTMGAQRSDILITLHAVVDRLYRSPMRNLDANVDPPIDEHTKVGVVVCAGLAREKLMDRRPIPCSQLAALLGMDRSRIRQFVRDGELNRSGKPPKRGRSMDAPIVWGDAKRVLAERHIPGFESADDDEGTRARAAHA